MGCCLSKRPSNKELAKRHNITEDQASTYKKAFDKYDKNHDGKISVTELGHMMESTGREKPDEATLKQMIETVDKNHSGFIEIEEFVSLLTKP